MTLFLSAPRHALVHPRMEKVNANTFPCLQCLLILIGYAWGQGAISGYSVLQQILQCKPLDIATKILSLGWSFGQSSSKKTVGGNLKLEVNYRTKLNFSNSTSDYLSSDETFKNVLIRNVIYRENLISLTYTIAIIYNTDILRFVKVLCVYVMCVCICSVWWHVIF